MASPRYRLGPAILLMAACADDPDPMVSEPIAKAPVAAPAPTRPEPPPAAAHVSQAEQARSILEHACGRCHIGPDSEVPAALAIFDLTEPDWTARMTDEALEGFVARLEDMAIPKDEADIVIGHVSRTLADRRTTQLAPPDC